ncbi:reversion-inducing cysteine-rich protein, partial [Lasius niger]
MEPSNVRGVLLLDEMKVSKTIAFNRNTLQVEGFTNLGKYTPKHQVEKKGDHALVFMFQPFKGKWVQTLGCFLSCGSASGAILHQLVMECIILAGKSGFKVDGVTSDGASWNRSMWDKFGVMEEEIPDGMLSLKHWYVLLAIENPKSFNLKVNYKLTEQHVKPKYYQKMNVAIAFQFFGVANAMELFKNDHSDLADCDESIKFCTRVKALITAMNSRTPINALKPSNQSWKDIEDFLQYLQAWEKEAKEKNYEFITKSTCYGLKVSLKATLEICTFLVQKCDFIYLMIARLIQDNLERFFGMMRHCCGSNEHPDSQLFIQMYKLVSTYSLIKPPKGCNISGGELMNVLLSIKDIRNFAERQQQWLDQIDTILDRGKNVDILAEAASELDGHDYFLCTTSDYVLSYIAEHIARKGPRFAKFGD